MSSLGIVVVGGLDNDSYCRKTRQSPSSLARRVRMREIAALFGISRVKSPLRPCRALSRADSGGHVMYKSIVIAAVLGAAIFTEKTAPAANGVKLTRVR